MNDLAPFIHPLADVRSTRIGVRTRIWQFCVVLEGAEIGTDCNICSHVYIENDVRVGDRATVKCGVQLWDGLHLGSDVHIGPNATFTNDKLPRSQQGASNTFIAIRTTIASYASIGANATILPGLTIGRGAMVGAGAVVTRDVPSHALVVGNPATFLRWVCRCGGRLDGLVCCTCGRRYAMYPGGSVYELE